MITTFLVGFLLNQHFGVRNRYCPWSV
jgi:hypothetical protein